MRRWDAEGLEVVSAARGSAAVSVGIRRNQV
jgi:hypothetical protein